MLFKSYFIKYNNKNLIQISVNSTNNKSCKLYSEQSLGNTLHHILCCSHLAPVVQKLDSTIHQINLYLVDSTIGFPNTYPLDSDLFGGLHYPPFEQLGPEITINL